MSIVKYHESHYVAVLDMYDNLWAHLRAEIYSEYHYVICFWENKMYTLKDLLHPATVKTKIPPSE